MSTFQTTAAEVGPIRVSSVEPDGGASRFLRRAALFVGIGLAIYLALYTVSEALVREHAQRNRFHAILNAPHAEYDAVILGASHAAAFDYRDMNARLERMTGATVLNLANVGAGITVNRLVLDYFFSKRSTAAVIYVLDSFGFYSEEWNEERARDSNLYVRAPWDAGLARLLLERPETRSAAIAYVSGFPKINNPDRFEPDLFPDEGSRFDRTYRPIAQLDRQRIEYLYADVGPDSFAESPYLDDFERMIADVHARGARFVVVRPPIPERFRAMIPFEDEFDAGLREVVARNGAELHDFSRVANDPELFYDSDHLNERGVLNFFEKHLSRVLSGEGPSDGGRPIDGAPAADEDSDR